MAPYWPPDPEQEYIDRKIQELRNQANQMYESSSLAQRQIESYAEWVRKKEMDSRTKEWVSSDTYYTERARLEQEIANRNVQAHEQQREIERLKNSIKTLKGGRMAKSDFFDSRGYCYQHQTRPCAKCNNEHLESQGKEESRALVAVASSYAHGGSSIEIEDQKITAKQELGRRTRFIKKALDLKEDAIKKTKVKDLPNLMKKAQDEITVGGMEELLDEDTKDAGGILKGIAKFFLKVFGSH